MAVASNGRRQNVEATLRVTNLLPLFDCVIASDDVLRGKPEPDVFLEAARRMKVEADRCVVFEDSSEGLEAAHRAGCEELIFERSTRRSGRSDARGVLPAERG